MPAVLTDSYLADPLVPADWRPVLEDLRAFVVREQELRTLARPLDVAEQADLVTLHDRLVERSERLLEPGAIADMAPQERGRLLLRSVLALMQLRQAAMADQPVLDTAGSRTLALFETDFYGSNDQVAALKERARIVLDLPMEDLQRQEHDLAGDLADARRKQAVVRALRDEFGLWPDGRAMRAGISKLFRAVYPGAPIPVDDVELVVTGTLVFFCLPLASDGESLTSERFGDLTADEQKEVRLFLQSLKRFAQERFANFPAFGVVQCDRIDPSLVERLAELAGVSAGEVLRELPRVITILPLDEIDKYLIHDVWGHGWQASMLRFDDLYERIGDFAKPLDLRESAATTTTTRIHLSECFSGTGDDLRLDAERFRAFAIAEVCQRLPVALSAVLAEMLADVAEYKFLAEHPQHAAWLPSSSRLAVYPSMLDLTLADIPFYFGQATKVFRLWAQQPARQARSVNQLIEAGAGRTAATVAVERAVAVWQELEADYFQPQLHWTEVEDGLHVNAFTRVMLNFVGLHRTVLATYRNLSALPTSSLALKSFRDLLVIAASVFFESEPARNLWRVDEFLALVLAPFCQQLAASTAALRGQETRAQRGETAVGDPR